jgi:hypothetical protein
MNGSVTVAAQQFVFMGNGGVGEDGGSSMGGGRAGGDGGSRIGVSANSNMSKGNSNVGNNNNNNSNNNNGNNQTSSLFSKLNSKSTLQRSNTTR